MHSAFRVGVLTFLVAVALVVHTPAGSAAGGLSTDASALDLAHAIAADPTVVAGASFVTVPPSGTPNARLSAPLAGFPSAGPDAALLTTGNALFANQPNTAPNTSADDGGGNVRGSGDFDVTILKVDLAVPAGVNCLVGLDFRFLSEEYREYVGSAFNDAFVAELDRSTWTTSCSSISAPNNFAFDPSFNPISINAAGVTSMSEGQAAGTTYDGATPLLTAATPLTPGAHSLYLSIFDAGDLDYDSAILLDNLRLGTVPDPVTDCVPGARPITPSNTPPAEPKWFPVTNGLDGAELAPLHLKYTTVEPAAAYSEEVGTNLVGVSSDLVTETLNLAGGYRANKLAYNLRATHSPTQISPHLPKPSWSADGKDPSWKEWVCGPGRWTAPCVANWQRYAPEVAKEVVDDLRTRVTRPGVVRPAIVLMLQEAKPVMVQAIAGELAAQFGRRVSTLYAYASGGGTATGITSLNDPSKVGCADGNPSIYRCEYGIAIVSTVPLLPLAGLHFNHDIASRAKPAEGQEHRVFIAATATINGRTVALATMHAQCCGNPKSRTEERNIVNRLAPKLPDTVLLGGDFNSAIESKGGGFKLDGFKRKISDGPTAGDDRIDYFLYRGVVSPIPLGSEMTRALAEPGTPVDTYDMPRYRLDHRRVASLWATFA